MRRYSLRFPLVLLAAYTLLHALIEFQIIHRGVMIPTLWGMLEWALTFPLSIWQFFYGLPESILGRLIYYVLVVANTIVVGITINKVFGSTPRDDGKQNKPAHENP